MGQPLPRDRPVLALGERRNPLLESMLPSFCLPHREKRGSVWVAIYPSWRRRRAVINQERESRTTPRSSL